MAVDEQQWNLFGYDLSRVAQYVQSGWRELLWGEPAGIRRHLDAPVELSGPRHGARALYIAETRVPTTAPVPQERPYSAVLLPAERVLLKNLTLPAALEFDLEQAIALEVQSSSPFPWDNSCYGWALRERSQDRLHLVLAIAARADVDACLATQGATAATDSVQPEVWALDDQQRPVVISGFGENARYRAYPRRVARVGARVALIALCLVALAALPGLVRSLQVQRMEGYLQAVTQESTEAQALREQLLRGNAQAQALQQLLDQQVDYLRVLDRLSTQTPYGVYLERFEAEGARTRLMGWADNAAAYMQILTGDAAYESVKTPSAFSRDRRTGLERFVLDLQLPTGTLAAMPESAPENVPANAPAGDEP